MEDADLNAVVIEKRKNERTLQHYATQATLGAMIAERDALRGILEVVARTNTTAQAALSIIKKVEL